ncbi:MAG: TonB C-terminal domain-containing protein [Candidatus Nitronauta litoralis]|uniref:TonB C-terminal domain-containing protein n=1 Tax=Candidatus Nitronauta litoralis TaxID=2705533 RepID=A0A7T0BVQ3_9BACT|nr:MAG: TonB C-terminal domain-containing protein [Candidatus Nitronauta litoralis]
MFTRKSRASLVSACLLTAVLFGDCQQVVAESDAYIEQAAPLEAEEDISISQSGPSAPESVPPDYLEDPVDISKMSLVGALLFSKYVHEVKDKIFKNWGSPEGAANARLLASVRVFPKGNIDHPTLVQSSGNKKLDHLALEAIRASEPFPPFPKELREPNLKIVVHFDYVYYEEEFQENELSKEEFF